MGRRCRHVRFTSWIAYDRPYERCHRTCDACDAWLPLGPSNDEPEAVQDEIDAAELAYDYLYGDMNDPNTFMAGCLKCGDDEETFESHFCVTYEVGMLARVIATHGGDDE